ncbi:uncharacterized protein LOC144118749, partial [Amblyomma americanum]
HWFVDGAFSVAPAVFYQLYTIHALQSGRVLRLAYCLLKRKTTATYTRIFRKMLELEPALSPMSLLTDFEQGAIQAFRSEVFDYFERTYIGVAFGRNRTRKDTPFPPTHWSCHDHVLDGLPKTNNSVEAWHDSLQQSLGFRHPDPYRLIAALKQEQSLTEQKQAEAGRWNAVSQRAAYAKIAERLQGVLANYSTTPLIAVMLGCRFTYEL